MHNPVKVIAASLLPLESISDAASNDLTEKVSNIGKTRVFLKTATYFNTDGIQAYGILCNNDLCVLKGFVRWD